jgi:hypothetical protein
MGVKLKSSDPYGSIFDGRQEMCCIAAAASQARLHCRANLKDVLIASVLK